MQKWWRCTFNGQLLRHNLALSLLKLGFLAEIDLRSFKKWLPWCWGLKSLSKTMVGTGIAPGKGFFGVDGV